MKRLLMLIPLAFLCCLTVSCISREESASQSAEDVEADIQAIKDLIVEFKAEFKTPDFDKILSYFADEIIRIPAKGSAAVGKEAIRARYEQMFNSLTIQQEDVIEDVQVSGDLAVAYVVFTYIATPKGGQDSIESNCNEIMVLRKQDDSTWKFIYLIWNDESLIYPSQA